MKSPITMPIIIPPYGKPKHAFPGSLGPKQSSRLFVLST